MKFRRQVPVGRFILDFYCSELRLALELDGPHHNTAWMSAYDSRRTELFTRRGIEILRIPNEDLVRDPRAVFERIALAIDSRRR